MTSNNYEEVNRAFELAVTKLRENLQYLADHDKVSDKFLSIQNSILKALVDYQHRTDKIIQGLQMEVHEVACSKHREYGQLMDCKESFEAICLIHGITDFACWMNKGKHFLVAEAVEYHRSGQFQLPYRLMKVLNSLDHNQRKMIITLINQYH